MLGLPTNDNLFVMLGQILNQTDKIVGHEQQSEDLYRNLSLRLKYQVEVLQEEI